MATEKSSNAKKFFFILGVPFIIAFIVLILALAYTDLQAFLQGMGKII